MYTCDKGRRSHKIIQGTNKWLWTESIHQNDQWEMKRLNDDLYRMQQKQTRCVESHLTNNFRHSLSFPSLCTVFPLVDGQSRGFLSIYPLDGSHINSHMHVISTSYPCHIHVICMSYPCHNHVISMSCPCHIHVISMSYACHIHGICMS